MWDGKKMRFRRKTGIAFRRRGGVSALGEASYGNPHEFTLEERRICRTVGEGLELEFITSNSPRRRASSNRDTGATVKS